MPKEIEDIVRNAGELLLRAFRGAQRFKEKERRHLLSEYDIAVDKYLTSELLRRFPDDSVFSEEASESRLGTELESELATESETGLGAWPEAAKSGGARWIVDPIDGSACFIFGEPYFSISIAKEQSGEIVEAHVYNPVSKEYFYSDTDCRRAYLNSDVINVSRISRMRDSLVAFGFSANIRAIKQYYADWPQTFEKCKKGIAWISPALSICNVARGRLEAFIDFGCSYEGQAAASLILRNSGGAMFNYDHTDYHHRAKGGIFTNGHFEIEMQEGRLKPFELMGNGEEPVR